ncbi:MAG: NUDIX hydrolase [Lachnospiraceae bacterium]
MRKQEVTTLCYLEQDGKYLLMHRTKKEQDINKDKYIGLGGHLEHGESPEECVRREILEESGLKAGNLRLRGIITFVIDDTDEYTFLYTGDDFSGELKECDEGDLVWIDKEELEKLPIWEGDKIFFRLLKEEHPFFSLKLTYVKDVLTDVSLDGQ